MVLWKFLKCFTTFSTNRLHSYSTIRLVDLIPKYRAPPILTPVNPSCKQNLVYVSFDTEYKGLPGNAHMTQVAGYRSEVNSINIYVDCTKALEERAKLRVDDKDEELINFLSNFSRSRSALYAPVLNGKQVMNLFIHWLDSMCNEDADIHVVLTAHNGLKADIPLLLHTLDTVQLTSSFLSKRVAFCDSYQLLRYVPRFVSHNKKRQSLNLTRLYNTLFPGEWFRAHDALADAAALHRILFQSALSDELSHMLPGFTYTKESVCAHLLFQRESLERRKELENLLCSNQILSRNEAKHLANAGLSLAIMSDVYNMDGHYGIHHLLFNVLNIRTSRIKQIIHNLCRYFDGIQK